MARTERYDAIQVRDKFLIAACAAVIARRRGLRFFFWLSFPEPEAQLLRVREGTARYRWLTAIRGGFFWLLLYRWILPRCDHVFVQSERMRQDVVAQGIPLEKMTAVPMGIAADDLGRRGIDARMLFVGDGERASDRQVIEERARQLGVQDRIEITGFMDRSAALQRMLEVDIALSPFFPTPILLSTSPTKLIEYMALGLPVIANDHPEQRLILRESRAGVRIPWGGRHFARAVAYLCGLTDEQRRDMGQCGREWVRQNRTYDHIADRVEAEYRRHLQSPKDAGTVVDGVTAERRER
jgi:hypothetical protein